MAVRFNPNVHKVVTIQQNNNAEKKDVKIFNTESDLCKAQQEASENAADKVLKELFEPVCKEFDLVYNKEFVLELLKKLNSNYSLKTDTETLKQAADCIQSAFKKHYDKETKTLDINNALKTAQHNLRISESNESPEDLKNKPKDIASVISTQYAKSHNGEKVDFNKLSAVEKKAFIKEYFESKIKEYMARPNMDETKAQQLLLVDFEILVSNTPDDEKHLLLETAAEVFKSHEAIQLLFDRFEDKNKAMQLADSVSLDYLKDKGLIAKEIVKHMSAEKAIEYLQTHDNEFKEFYASNKEIVDRVIDKVQKGEELSEEEQGIKAKLDSYEELRNILITGTRENVYMSQDDKRKIEYKIKEIEDKQPSKLREYKQFYEAEKSAKEKSATDETGKFKTVSGEIIAKSEEKIQAFKQIIDEAAKPEPIVVKKGETADTSDTGAVNYDTITGDDGTDIIKDIFTGKIKVSEYLEQVAIKKYKLMDTAMQGNILLNATGEFFNDLVQNLETSTFEHLLSIGWKGRSYNATQKVKDEVEERRDDVA